MTIKSRITSLPVDASEALENSSSTYIMDSHSPRSRTAAILFQASPILPTPSLPPDTIPHDRSSFHTRSPTPSSYQRSQSNDDSNVVNMLRRAINEASFYFHEKRHELHLQPLVHLSESHQLQEWRIRERMKTISVALILCLNIGVNPPDLIKPRPCAKLECWVDPSSMLPQKALEQIGKNLQAQYEVWQPRARYKQSLDPTAEEIKKICSTLRRNAKDERVLFHYNGHGVPKPTASGELWVFNKNYTQYIPVSIYDIQEWMGTPSILVYDCSSAASILLAFNNFARQNDAAATNLPSDKNLTASEDALESLHFTLMLMNIRKGLEASDSSFPLASHPAATATSMADSIQLAACGPNEILPMNPELPADIFTSCLTTPIEIALRWFVLQNPLLTRVTADMVDKIPGFCVSPILSVE